MNLSAPRISVIIPVHNEAENLQFLIPYLKSEGGRYLSEIIVVDGESTDGSIKVANQLGAKVIQSLKGRARQLNKGASAANGNILYFVHADTRPPATYGTDISEAIDHESEAGCFRFKFDSSKWYFRINDFFTRFKPLWCRGGDQSLYVTQSLFRSIGGFDESYEVMEEYKFIEEAMKATFFKVIPKAVIVSSRKYDKNNYIKVQWANFLAFRMYKKGVPSSTIKKRYYELLQLPNYQSSL
jgi:rSAM/selenodomain-associated transferase 2